ncbi:hypothetical protein TNIN_447771 [Trichonephila inaurata madagascariensis]|uniref:TIL domain-containing protein n=1 Tax=Trichonephila inaurata madagascariensis TaxID=2747483 RepID=A0A8X6MFE4_9ARAC|nr:hypothetical protein TNIN_447771 [Trichonephila inaurata madagascariensis]
MVSLNLLMLLTMHFPEKCGVDEEFYQCTPSCKNTCENFRNPTALCQCGPPGCFCKKGLVKRADGKCVPPNQCPVKCAVDEQYYACTPLCKNTCENFDNPRVRCQCGPPGCFCRAGLVRRADGKCVRPNQCPVKCGVNERYYQCTPSCKNTCENFNNPGVRCQCGPPGCFCREGLVRRSDGRCIIPSQCPAKCGDNEEYYLCPPSCKNTCENYTNPNVQCQCGPPGCFCKRGLVKTEDGRCIYPTQCIKKPPRCQENAEYLTCGPSCRPTCKNPYTGSCPARCVPGCFCKPGFVEDHDGRCVHLERCEKRNFVTLMSLDIFRAVNIPRKNSKNVEPRVQKPAKTEAILIPAAVPSVATGDASVRKVSSGPKKGLVYHSAIVQEEPSSHQRLLAQSEYNHIQCPPPDSYLTIAMDALIDHNAVFIAGVRAVTQEFVLVIDNYTANVYDFSSHIKKK